MRVFDDFLTMAICCFSFGKMEDVYFQTIKGYTKEELIYFSHLIGALMTDYEKKSDSDGAWHDGLGDFFMENNSNFGQDARGQFFTPEEICNMIAKVSYQEDVKEERNILDPAAGSGRMLLAFDRLNPNFRYQNFYVAADIDSRCVKMCTLNFFLYGLKGAVIHMDSLKMDIWGGYRVFLTETGLGIRPLNSNECRGFILSNPVEETAKVQNPIIKPSFQILKAEKVSQLTLF